MDGLAIGAAARIVAVDWTVLAVDEAKRLQALGITHIHGNDGTSPWCTVTNASRFFSHRRDSGALGASGRFAACVWIDAGGR